MYGTAWSLILHSHRSSKGTTLAVSCTHTQHLCHSWMSELYSHCLVLFYYFIANLIPTVLLVPPVTGCLQYAMMQVMMAATALRKTLIPRELSCDTPTMDN